MWQAQSLRALGAGRDLGASTVEGREPDARARRRVPWTSLPRPTDAGAWSTTETSKYPLCQSAGVDWPLAITSR